jgi:hypothetical protein
MVYCTLDIKYSIKKFFVNTIIGGRAIFARGGECDEFVEKSPPKMKKC